jgi:ATP-dependent helicase/nuclease subunit A
MAEQNDYTEYPIEFTDEQRQAVEHFGTNVFVNAGAGSGKTRILVARYVEILKRGLADINDIVAITFTRKAAKEMKGRIQDHLAREFLSPDLLYELEAAPISTIHGFCSRLLRENAARVGIDPSFRVMEEIEGFIFRENEIRDAVLEAIDRGGDRVVELAGKFGFTDLFGLFKKIYVNRGSMAEWIDYDSGRADSPPTEKDIAKWVDLRLQLAMQDPLLNRSVGVLENRMSRDREDRIEILRCELLSLVDALQSGTRAESVVSTMKKIVGINLGGGKPTAWDGDDLVQVKEAIKGIRNLFKGVFEETAPLPREQEEGSDESVKTLLREFIRIERDLSRRKQAENLLDYDDLLLITRDVLRENQELRNRLRQKYRFFLVDEFQDTDRVQWEILCLLTSPTGDPGGDRLFLVGDFGQSIYRFRGAEVQIFSRAGHAIRGEGGKEFSLTRNFRSAPSIITFINWFQEKVEMEERRVTEVPRRILLKPFRDRDTGKPPVEILAVTGETGVDREMCRKAEAEHLANKIREVVENESRDYGDIAFLFRSMSYVWIYETALRREGIPYSLIKGGKFFGLQEIRDVMNALKAIDDEGDEIALAGLMRSPFFGVSDDGIHQFWMNDQPDSTWLPRSVGEGFSTEDRRILEGIEDFLAEARERKDSTSLFDLLSWMLEETSFPEVLLGLPGGERKVLNVYKLLQIAQAVESNRMFELGDFIRFIDHATFQDLYESEAPVELDEAGVVKIMSVHSAKGLQFPVVVLPDLLWQRGTESPILIHHPEYGFAIREADIKAKRPMKYRAVTFFNKEEDRREWTRQLYVAMTRARDKLILSVSMPGSTSPAQISSAWIRWIWDLLPRDVRERFRDDSEKVVDERIRDICGVTHHACTEVETTIRGREMSSKAEASAGSLSGLPDDILSRIEPVERGFDSRNLTVTQLLDSIDCPRSYYLRHILGCPDAERLLSEPYRSIESPSIGGILHRVLEIWNLESIESLTEIIREQVVGETGDYDDGLEARIIELLGPFRKSKLIEELRSAEKRGHLHREWLFTILVGRYPITGSLDAVFENERGDPVIVDYKTIEAGEASQVRTLGRFELQLQLYALAYGRITGKNPREGIVYFLPTGFAHRVALESIGDFERYFQNSVERLARMETEPSLCPYCDLKRICRKA